MKKSFAALYLFSALFITGCGSEVTSVQATGETKVSQATHSCNYASFCFTCMPGFDMKLECGFKFSYFCDGTQDVKVEETPVKISYADGFSKNDIKTKITPTGACHG